MEKEKFDLETDVVHTGTVEWRELGEDESPSEIYELNFNGKRISLADFGKYLEMYDGWKIDLKIYDGSDVSESIRS